MKATVVIPNLNGAGWLRDSIESVWTQTMQDFELIVIDNASTDEVWRLPAAMWAGKTIPSLKTTTTPDSPTR